MKSQCQLARVSDFLEKNRNSSYHFVNSGLNFLRFPIKFETLGHHKTKKEPQVVPSELDQLHLELNAIISNSFFM